RMANRNAFVLDGAEFGPHRRPKTETHVGRLEGQARRVFAWPAPQIVVIGAEANRAVRLQTKSLPSPVPPKRQVDVRLLARDSGPGTAPGLLRHLGDAVVECSGAPRLLGGRDGCISPLIALRQNRHAEVRQEERALL